MDNLPSENGDKDSNWNKGDGNSAALNKKLSLYLQSLMEEGEYIESGEELQHVLSVAILPREEEVNGTLTIWNAGVNADQKINVIAHLCEKVIETGILRNHLLTQLIIRITPTDQVL